VVEAGGSQVQGQAGLQSETVSKRKNVKERLVIKCKSRVDVSYCNFPITL
jgi:hypothetical protein